MAQHVFVVAFVTNGNYKTRPNVQRNTYSPKVTLRTDTGYGTYRWYKIEDLQIKRADRGAKLETANQALYLPDSVSHVHHQIGRQRH